MLKFTVQKKYRFFYFIMVENMINYYVIKGDIYEKYD